MLKNTKILSFLLLVALLVIMIAAPNIEIAYGAEPELYVTINQATEEANKLNTLGLFLGSDGGYELDRAPTRTEGVIMLIRMMGEEDAAKSCAYTHPFKDVPAWADRYIAWAYTKGYTNGTSATTFTPNDKITSVMYLTLMIRALGYGNEFTYQNAVRDATEIGLITSSTYTNESVPFLRADMVHISYRALQTNEKSTKKPLYTILVGKNAIDESKANAMFNPNPNSGNNGNSGGIGGGSPSTNDLLDFLGGGSSGGGNNNSGGGQSNAPEKYYSFTNTNNDKSRYTVSIQGNTVTVSGIENTDTDYVTIALYEVKTIASAGRANEDEEVLCSYVLSPTPTFSDSITIPALKYGNYFELVVEAGNEFGSPNVLEKIWIKGSPNAWYFEGPVKLSSNNTLLQTANNTSPSNWLKLRTITEDFKTKVLNLMGAPASSDYETAYNVMTWINENISYLYVHENSSSKVLESRVATCEGYSNLMVDALAAYGIPARSVIGETLLGYAMRDSFASSSFVNHQWVEFYDSATNRWVVCDPTMASAAPSHFFDMNRTYVALVMKATKYA